MQAPQLVRNSVSPTGQTNPNQWSMQFDKQVSFFHEMCYARPSLTPRLSERSAFSPPKWTGSKAREVGGSGRQRSVMHISQNTGSCHSQYIQCGFQLRRIHGFAADISVY